MWARIRLGDYSPEWIFDDQKSGSKISIRLCTVYACSVKEIGKMAMKRYGRAVVLFFVLRNSIWVWCPLVFIRATIVFSSSRRWTIDAAQTAENICGIGLSNRIAPPRNETINFPLERELLYAVRFFTASKIIFGWDFIKSARFPLPTEPKSLNRDLISDAICCISSHSAYSFDCDGPGGLLPIKLRWS